MLAGVLTLTGVAASAGEAEDLYETFRDRLYQVEIVARSSQNKTATGSAFQVREDGLLVTNYHVVSDAVAHPDAYEVRYVGHAGQRGTMQVVDVDVVNDLALVEKSPGGRVIEFAERMPAQGAPIYSLGNPLNLGVAVVPGTYNGITDKSYHQRIHFTGAVNSGMSGGPVIDAQGKLVGVNVATAGNQVGFLVHLDRVRALVEGYQRDTQLAQDLTARIGQQLLDSQRGFLEGMLANEWQTSRLGDVQVLSDISPHLQCWGSTNKDDAEARFGRAVRKCQTTEDIFLARRHQTGKILFEYVWLDGHGLNRFQLASLVEQIFSSTHPGSRAGKDDVGNFRCHEGFMAEPLEKSVFCARPYKRYPGVYDVLFTSSAMLPGRRALVSHFTLAGVDQDSALRFAERFIEGRSWNW